MLSVAIGVDIGTTQTKAVAFDNKGMVQATHYEKYPLIQELVGMVEQNQEQIFRAVIHCIAVVAEKVQPATVEFVSFSTAMHSLIVMDKMNQPITRSITWADNRSKIYADELDGTEAGQQFYKKMGLPMHPMTPFHKIRWLKKEYPRIYEQGQKFIGIKEYIFFRLFGKYVTDYSTASGTGLLNIHELKWETTALEEIGLSEQQLPNLVSPEFQLSSLSEEWREQLNLSKETIFILGGADGPLSNLGLGALASGVGALTVGTSGALRYVLDQPFINKNGETFCCVLDEEHWVIGGATSNGAGIFDWACENFLREVQAEAVLAGDSPYSAVLNCIENINAGASGLLFYPYLLGERAPLWDAEASGSFVGLKRNHDDLMLMRAVLEGICLNLKQILTGLESSGTKIQELRATGGFAASKVFRQLMADVLGRPLLFTESTEASAFGAILIGWKSTGKIASYQAVKDFVPIHERVEPSLINKKIYEEIYPVFIEIQQQLRNSYSLLNQLNKII